MTSLPAALEPWSKPLALFPPEVALVLGPWVQRLSLALGPLRLASLEGQGDPDGVGGLARRGSYERLLLTEWLLAEEAPLEFQRRATMGEHLFLATALRKPAGTACCTALFDAGPSQLGAPRLAHLALLIALAQRAEDAGATFHWGVLQSPETGLTDGVTEENVRRLLEARVARDPGDAELDAWRERLNGLEGTRESWTIGGARALESSEGSRAAVRDVIEPGARRVGVAVRAASAPAREVELELPEERLCVRLMRDPFALARPQPPSRGEGLVIRRDSGLLFCNEGRRLWVCLADGRLAALPVPNSARESMGKPKLFAVPPEEAVVAVGWHGRGGVLVVTRHEPSGEVVLYGLGRERSLSGHRFSRWQTPAAARFLGTPAGRENLGRCFAISPFAALFVDGAHNLCAVRGGHEGVDCVDAGIASVQKCGNDVVWVNQQGRMLKMRAQEAGYDFLGALSEKEAPLNAQLADIQGALAAHQLSERVWQLSWQLTQGSMPVELHLPEGVQVEGVLAGSAGPELLVRENDDRTLAIIGRHTSFTLPKASSEIATLDVSASRGLVAWLTVDGELVVYSLKRRELVLQLLPGGAP